MYGWIYRKMPHDSFDPFKCYTKWPLFKRRKNENQSQTPSALETPSQNPSFTFPSKPSPSLPPPSLSFSTYLLCEKKKANILSFLTRGYVFWKAGASLHPHFLFFRLDPSRKYIQWYSRNKPLNRTRISLCNIRKVYFGNNPKFKPYCNPELMARCISIRGMDVASSKRDKRAGKEGISEVDFISLSAIPFLFWKFGLVAIQNFFRKLYDSSRNRGGAGSNFGGPEGGWECIDFVRELPEMQAELNIPSGLFKKAHLLYGFEFFVAQKEKEKRQSAPPSVTQPSAKPRAPSTPSQTPSSFHYSSSVDKVTSRSPLNYSRFILEISLEQQYYFEWSLFKVKRRVKKSKRLNGEDKEWILERLSTIEQDINQIKGMGDSLIMGHKRRIIWLAIAEVVALNEVVVAIENSEREKASKKTF